MKDYVVVEDKGLRSEPIASFSTSREALDLLEILNQRFWTEHPNIYYRLNPYRVVELEC